MRSMRTLFITLALVGFACGDDGNTTPVDAPVTPQIDAAPPTPPLALNCTTYCTELAKACPAPNAQFVNNCMGTCAAYPLGAQADTSGNTLGCRNYHVQNITVRSQAPATHCPHAGPVGGPIAAATGTCGATACENFCAMEAKVCGIDAAQVTVAGTVIVNRYADTAACMTACTGFTKTPEYSPTVAGGNNFACRFYHLTNAAAQTTAAGVNTHCGHTLLAGGGVCVDPPAP
jgi:hypothetical protein